MADREVSVHGDLLRQTREQKGLSLRTVQALGGPCLSYQSDIERGHKEEISFKLLKQWTEVLGVTPAFACGQVPRYCENPEQCSGLADDVEWLIQSGQEQEVHQRSGTDRVARILHLIAWQSRCFTPTVLAWSLGIELSTLEAIMNGEIAPARWLTEAASTLTKLPWAFVTGTAVGPDEARPLTDQTLAKAAEEHHTTLSEAKELMGYVHLLPALRLLRKAGKGLTELELWLGAEH